jgi:saccharopine dehydrogenase-like NADP-dependent oxidoreductase
MNRVAVLGAGFVAKPAVDYFLDRCGYHVCVTSLKASEAKRLIGGRPAGKALALSVEQSDLLDRIVGDADLVMSLIPPAMHMAVAQACLKHRKPMVTTSYVSPQMAALDDACRQSGVLILNEIGEDPGLDHMGAKRLLDRIRAGGGQVTAVASYGAGLPAFKHNNNPVGYKFSWSPMGMILAAQAPAVYIDQGKVVKVPGADLFSHCRCVVLEELGTFETYPNRDCTPYLESLGLSGDVSLFRGILRYPGWCRLMNALARLQMFDTGVEKAVTGSSYAAFTAALIGEDSPSGIIAKTARFLDVDTGSDLIGKLKWLGFFDERRIDRINGTNADILVDMMVRKMSYAPLEQDMVIVHNAIDAQFAEGKQRWMSTLLAEGQPAGDSAMSRAVSLPAAIAARLILEGRIQAKGIQRPTFREIYRPVLDEMREFGFGFNDNTISLT